ncbi:Acetamidase [Psilocybe cubensis]|uniref:Amidase domain-containing protein n=2 Tax=Psilocybe cubensis TaxID=181762 RepID=A0A8H8CHS8_PSICU|nr:Acetamidase [Psilocybe cubensis]KAH9474405.1 Acetamidase [Psilocybe cubensis]
MASKHWTELVDEKKKRQTASIPKEWILTNLPSKDTLNVMDFPEKSGLLDAKEVEITNSDVDALLEKLATGKWTAVEVTIAFSKRAIIAHQLVNCLTEIFIERAVARAAELDDHLKRTGRVVGPLHGLPISLKDQVNIKGLESTLGYVSWIGKFADRNAVLADILEACGAVLYVKTNVPQTLMWIETFNHVFGRTLNPHNRSLTAGGSSGGEAALIGKSIRIPAAFNGLYGLSPSQRRVPYAGCVNTSEGQDSVLSVLGPLSNSLSGIKIFMEAVSSQMAWLKDPLVIRKPWNDEEYQLSDHGRGGRLCFAILWHDGVELPHPPIIRALETTKSVLIRAGHNVIDWKPLKHGEIYKTLVDIWAAGAYEDYHTSVLPSGEPLIQNMSTTAERAPFSGPAVRPFVKAESVTAYQLWQVQRRRTELRQEYLDHWNSTAAYTGTGRPVDVIISPCAAHVAPPHGMAKTPSYTMIWNALDYTSLAIPTGLSVDAALDVKKLPHTFFTEQDKANYEFYEVEKFRDAPISIQLIGRNMEEEAIISIGEIVETSLRHFT